MIRKKTDSGWWEGELQVSLIKHFQYFINIFIFHFRRKDVVDKLDGSQRPT